MRALLIVGYALLFGLALGLLAWWLTEPAVMRALGWTS